MNAQRSPQASRPNGDANVDETPPPPDPAFAAGPVPQLPALRPSAPGIPHVATRVRFDVMAGPHAGKTIECEQHETLVVGRASGVQLQLEGDPYFSRFHCRLEIRPPECYLLDLGSRNGIYVNDRRIHEAFLQDNDIIAGGRTKIRFTVVRPTHPATPDPAPHDAGTVLTPVDHGVERKPEPLPHLPLIPGYEIVRVLGEGAMGVVYQAIRRATGEPLALKTIVPSRDTSPHAIPLFVREASVLSQLRHPRIVQFHELGMAGGELYLAMEYVPTVNLQQVLESQSAEARTRICCAVICQVLDALGHAHSLSLVHRDIKPSNLLAMRSGRKLNVKISDFGLAKNYVDAGFSAMTRDGECRGTLAFMPPEQIINCRYAKPACDLYSAGATLYYLLASAYPFEFSANRSKYSVVLEDAPIPLSVRRPDLPPELSAIIEHALVKDPARRFATAAEMHQELFPFSQRT